MEGKENKKNENKVKSFFSRFIERIDRKFREKAKSNKCCGSADAPGKSCCS